jgi:hypothetical protein
MRVFFFVKKAKGEFREKRRAAYRAGRILKEVLHTYTSFASAGVVLAACGQKISVSGIKEVEDISSKWFPKPWKWCSGCLLDYNAEKTGEIFLRDTK